MAIKTAERVSREASDNYVFQRSRLAYVEASRMVSGRVLEIGTGTGYGAEIVAPSAERFTTIDKTRSEELGMLPANVEFVEAKVPPLPFADNTFDYVVSFQVIEHIPNDRAFVAEVLRVLRHGGKFIVSTPNRPMSLTRNPWHVREYTAEQFASLLSSFSSVERRGVEGNERVWEYYEKNRESVHRIMRFDVLRMQWWLPRWILQIPYDIMNRLNRRRLHSANRSLTEGIAMEDYSVVDVHDKCFDLFYIATK
ncbi:MAG: class I SAM-dependent methyltransferase [Alistipes sp.]|jgi:SAM-dependent methyltransferase|nr:class I SAM-dependent methyltransferase [Alistipes sp.]MEE1149128.1 class I SAM-dependent methyltransferase [Alistipes sp.]